MLVEGANRTQVSLIDRIGIHPSFAPEYLGLLPVMIGDGVESGCLSPYLNSLGISEGRVSWIFAVFGAAAAVAAWLSGPCPTFGALGGSCGPVC